PSARSESDATLVLLPLDEVAPSPPERADLTFVLPVLLGERHPLGEIAPPRTVGAGVAALTRLDRLDVVRRREPGGSEELEVVVEAPREERLALLGRGERPRVDEHRLGSDRLERADGDRADVVDDQVRKDQQVPAGERD